MIKDVVISGILLDDSTELTLGELCYACSQPAEWVTELIEEGVLEPFGDNQEQWRFPAVSLQRVHTAMRLQRDLGINIAGIALVLDLLDEVETLRLKRSRSVTDNYLSRDLT